jgi:uncharacterized Fe-S center protein
MRIVKQEKSMPTPVYFGSARQARLEANETLPAKLDMILERLNLRERVKGETVLLKMHLGNNLSYSTIHPVFVRKVVKAILDGGGKPFVADVNWDAVNAEHRGYSSEVVGCPVYPIAGPDERYFYTHTERPYKNIQSWKVAGAVEDASFLVNFAHVKGHPSCSYGGAIKNIALGCMVGETRSAMHDTNHYDPYWFGDLCPDEETRQRIIASCPQQALVEDRDRPGELHLHFEQCNQCGRCLEVAPPGSLKIDAANFLAFQEACAISTAVSLDTFEREKMIHLNLATHMTPVCDCFGFTSMQIMRDIGIFGSDDIVAVEKATLDCTGQAPLIEENLPTSMYVSNREGHPFTWIHGPLKDPYAVVRYCEQLGLGSQDYELVDICPVEERATGSIGYVSAH